MIAANTKEKISFCKQIVRQHPWSNRLHIGWGHKNDEDNGALPPWDRGVADPLKHAPTPRVIIPNFSL